MQCSNIPITTSGARQFDVGYVQWLLGMGGLRVFVLAIPHAGWLPRAFFDAIAAWRRRLHSRSHASPSCGSYSRPTDVDGNGKEDVAFREVYYNDDFIWDIDSATAYDVETVRVHEVGHGLSQAHFGDIFGDAVANGKLHFAPRAVMNAAYSGVQRHPPAPTSLDTAVSGRSWPNN